MSMDSGFCLEAKQGSSTCPIADALWPVSHELLAFVELPAHSFHPIKASSTGTAWQHSLQRPRTAWDAKGELLSQLKCWSKSGTLPCTLPSSMALLLDFQINTLVCLEETWLEI